MQGRGRMAWLCTVCLQAADPEDDISSAVSKPLLVWALQFGYSVYRRVLGYYSGTEDALDLRKAMPRDVQKKSIVPLERPIHPHELEHD